jgi:hypothetical protein
VTDTADVTPPEIVSLSDIPGVWEYEDAPQAARPSVILNNTPSSGWPDKGVKLIDMAGQSAQILLATFVPVVLTGL